jgi:hypothetical protein
MRLELPRLRAAAAPGLCRVLGRPSRRASLLAVILGMDDESGEQCDDNEAPAHALRVCPTRSTIKDGGSDPNVARSRWNPVARVQRRLSSPWPSWPAPP